MKIKKLNEAGEKYGAEASTTTYDDNLDAQDWSDEEIAQARKEKADSVQKTNAEINLNKEKSDRRDTKYNAEYWKEKFDANPLSKDKVNVVRECLTSLYGDAINLTFIDKLPPQFISQWAESMKFDEMIRQDNIFIKLLKNKNDKMNTILSNQKLFSNMYNAYVDEIITRDNANSNPNDYKSIVYNPTLYNRDYNSMKKILELYNAAIDKNGVIKLRDRFSNSSYLSSVLKNIDNADKISNAFLNVIFDKNGAVRSLEDIEHTLNNNLDNDRSDEIFYRTSEDDKLKLIKRLMSNTKDIKNKELKDLILQLK